MIEGVFLPVALGVGFKVGDGLIRVVQVEEIIPPQTVVCLAVIRIELQRFQQFGQVPGTIGRVQIALGKIEIAVRVIVEREAFSK